MTKTARTTMSVNGTDIMLGDYVYAYRGYVAKIEKCQLPEGALYADCTLDTGEIIRCWGGFLYHIGR